MLDADGTQETKGINTRNSSSSIRERAKSGQRERAQLGNKARGDSRPRLSGRAQLDSLLVVMGKLSRYRAADVAITALALP
jgi:hypothetical protein